MSHLRPLLRDPLFYLALGAVIVSLYTLAAF